ncbi:hypothetical protein NESM_000690500 [Novymonas esmeraldas]|uniref:Uncharacterized protein n=1 Tax=Novymonas esmeraldas TaxID=1808958 RepID=A0AAW0EV98_9TRYP
MRPIALTFQLPSLRGACEANRQRSSDAAAAAETIAVPYPVGTGTLQVSGIHVRLHPTKTHAVTTRGGGAGRPSRPPPPAPDARAASTTVGTSDALTANIVVHAHVRGELSSAPQSYVVAVVPLRLDSAAASSTTTAAAAAAAAPTAQSPAAYDKRVLNAQARDARRGAVAPVFASAFAKVDLRTQVERVRLSFTVVPCGRLGDSGAATAHAGKRPRDEAAGASVPSAAALDCAVDVTVVGTVSALV